jgi:hypothetical protein
MEVWGQLQTPAALLPDTHWIGGWVGPRAGMDTVSWKIPSPRRDSNLEHPIVKAVVIRYTDWAIAAL